MSSRQDPGFQHSPRLACTIGRTHYVELFFGGDELLASIVKHLDRQLLGHIYSFLDESTYSLMRLEPLPVVLLADIEAAKQTGQVAQPRCEVALERRINKKKRPERLRKAHGK